MRSCSPGDVVVSQHALGGRGVASRGCGRREGLTEEAGGADMVLHVLRVRWNTHREDEPSESSFSLHEASRNKNKIKFTLNKIQLDAQVRSGPTLSSSLFLPLLLLTGHLLRPSSTLTCGLLLPSDWTRPGASGGVVNYTREKLNRVWSDWWCRLWKHLRIIVLSLSRLTDGVHVEQRPDFTPSAGSASCTAN